MEKAQLVLDEMRQHGPAFVATLNKDGSITPKPIIGYVEEVYPHDQPKPGVGTTQFYKQYAMPVTGEHRVANPSHISNEKWNDAGRRCTNLYRKYIGKRYRYLIKDIEHGDIDGMESVLYHGSRKNDPKKYGRRLTEEIKQMPLDIAEVQRGLHDHLQRGLHDHLEVFKELQEYVDGSSDPKVKHSYIKMTEEDFVSSFIDKLRPHLPRMTDLFDDDERRGKDWNIKTLREYIDRFENKGWLKTKREDIVQPKGEEVAQLKAENARLGTENHGLRKSHESLTYLNNDLWRANNAAKQAAEKAAKQIEQAAEEKAKWAAVEKAQALAAEKAKWQAEEKAKKEAAEKAKKEAEEKAKKEAEEKAKKEAEKELREQKEEEKQEPLLQHREQQEQQQQRRLRKEQKKQKKLERIKKSKKCLRGGSREASDLQNPWKTNKFMHTQQKVQQVGTAEHDRKDEEQQEQPVQKGKKKRKRGNRGKGNVAASHQRRQVNRQKDAQTRRGSGAIQKL
jgi:hypothetical protein